MEKAEIVSDRIVIPAGAYAPHKGALAILTNKGKSISNWYTCREQFHPVLRRRKAEKDFLFSAQTPFGKRCVIKFIEEVQRRIGVPSDKWVTFRDTNVAGVLSVSPGPWWSNQEMKLSFLTILLRCGLTYDPDNPTEAVFNNALFCREYTRDTKPAVDRFMSGHTKFKGNSNMWYQTFHCGGRKGRIDYAARTLVKESDESEVSAESLAEAKKIVDMAGNDKEMLKLFIAQSFDQMKSSNNSHGVVGEKITY